ncbi:hypothetical protein IT774_08110 [Salinimonas marina]|uniref:Uncharacterized protein n=1 Tax=Salinimonas marina TaxID=2785918 RepID=A0A7S9E061_9ALTE|nr:hypothetical protein [Salinimonas marina]QPG07052.1 hypothetical protein IT774_08110 [Salinimonas marina]
MAKKKKFVSYVKSAGPQQSKAKANPEAQETSPEPNNVRLLESMSPEAVQCYDELREKTGWSDKDMVSNAIRLMYASYKCGQVRLLNEWLKDHKR